MKGYSKFLILPNEIKDPDFVVTRIIVDEIHNLSAEAIFEDKHLALASQTCSATLSNCEEKPECVIVIGGDGTVLDSIVTALEWDIPFIGVNQGHLGFLAEADACDLSWITRLYNGQFELTERMLLSLNPQLNAEKPALNEICLYAGAGEGIADMLLTDNTGNEIKYRGDGLIVATPSGSTAYSFSAGGPVVDSSLNVICVTPVCPHSFFNRTMILGSDAVIKVRNTSSRRELLIKIDGRTVGSLKKGEEIEVSQANRKLKVITFGHIPTFSTFRRKMELVELKD
jgi:NAD+ kinase